MGKTSKGLLMRGDGKSKFYRTLKLDKEDWESLKFFNKIKRKMINEIKKKKTKDE